MPDLKRLKMTEDDRRDTLDWLRRYTDEHCVYRVARGSGDRLDGKAPGTVYTWQFYLRRGLFNPDYMDAVGRLFLDWVATDVGHVDFQLAGLETASTPMLSGLSMAALARGVKINAFSVRKNQKDYGIRNWIEGMPSERPVMLVDDLCSSTGSLRRAAEVVREHAMTVFKKAFVVVNKVNLQDNPDRAGRDIWLDQDVECKSLFTLDDFGLRLRPGGHAKAEGETTLANSPGWFPQASLAPYAEVRDERVVEPVGDKPVKKRRRTRRSVERD